MDGIEVAICVVVAVLAFGFGVTVGSDSVAKDCKSLGLFRKGDTVYVCHAK